MTEQEKKNLVIMNISGIYEIWKNPPKDAVWIQGTDLTGTNCYCDDFARDILCQRMESFPVAGIHLIDSGNYHYLTKLWIEQYKEPFQLLQLDNHTDLQPPAFGNLLSCGGWVYSALEELSNLKKVFLIGPGEKDYRQIPERYQEKLYFCSRETLWKTRETTDGIQKWAESFTEELDPKLPLYVSIDKDILCPEDAKTTWSQGDMRLSELLRILSVLLRWEREKKGRILGVDLCGTVEKSQSEDHQINEKADLALIHLLQK